MSDARMPDRSLPCSVPILRLKKGFIAIAGEFLGRYPKCIPLASHRSRLPAKASPCKVVAKQEDVIAMLSYEGSGDPLHRQDAVSHSRLRYGKELPPEEVLSKRHIELNSNWISKLRPAGVPPVRSVLSASQLHRLPRRGGPTGTGTPAGRSPRPLAANRSDLPTG